MFDTLSERLQAALSDVRSRGKLTEEDISKAMRAIRLALLEADVNFQVVKSFTSQVKERALGEDVAQSLTPGQMVTKIVSDELTELMGGAARDIAISPSKPTVILMAGLQGSGKTTAVGKLARHLREEKGLKVAVAAADLQRPAAVEQLIRVGGQAGATVYEQGTGRDPVDVAEWALGQAKANGDDVLIVDTAGRLHVDDELMDQLAKIKKRTRPHDVLLVVDAMTGQDAVNVAEAFGNQVGFDGVVMTKLDGDARGGAALSVKAITGKPILYASTGEKLDAFERFHPDRMAQRILGMGDVMSLIEKVEKQTDEDKAKELEQDAQPAAAHGRRPLIVYSAICSLDGYIEDRDGKFDWARPSDEVHAFVNAKERAIDTYLYGRGMYETMVAWETIDDPDPIMREYAEIWRAADKVVFSNTLNEVRSERTRIERRFDPDAVPPGLASIGGPGL